MYSQMRMNVFSRVYAARPPVRTVSAATVVSVLLAPSSTRPPCHVLVSSNLISVYSSDASISLF